VVRVTPVKGKVPKSLQKYMSIWVIISVSRKSLIEVNSVVVGTLK
jgi:hypothetical protein